MEWTAQDIRDAQRLLRVLVERADKRTLAGGDLGPAEIRDQPLSPAENGGQSPSANSVGSAALKGSGRQSTDADREDRGNGCDVGGHAAAMAVAAISFEDTNGCACPTPDDAVGGRSRRDRRSGGLE